MDLSRVVVTIESGRGLGGVYPFVVVCYDNDLSHELYKTPATRGNKVSEWGETFEVNLRAEEKGRAAAHQNPPTYLTFFVYDTGRPGAPPLGSAGVLLDTVRQSGVAQGDFPIVNGQRDASLSLVVDAKGTTTVAGPQGEGESANMPWYKTKTAKAAAGAIGAGAVLAGVTAMAVGQKKKNKKKKEQEDLARQADLVQNEHDDHDGGAAGLPRRLPPGAAPLHYPGDPGDDDDDDGVQVGVLDHHGDSDEAVGIHVDRRLPGAAQ